MWPDRREERTMCEELECPRGIPWDFIAGHEEQAKDNHDQSLKTLARRGGLDPTEAVAVLEDRRWQSMTLEDGIKRLKELVLNYVSNPTCSWCDEPAVAKGDDDTYSCGSGQGDGKEHHCTIGVEYTSIVGGMGWTRVR
jgi:hypothetical protein